MVFCNGGADYAKLERNKQFDNTTLRFFVSTGQAGTRTTAKTLPQSDREKENRKCFRNTKIDFEQHPKSHLFKGDGVNCSEIKSALYLYQRFLVNRINTVSTTIKYVHVGHDTDVGVLPELCWLHQQNIYLVRLRTTSMETALTMTKAGKEPCKNFGFAPCPFTSRVVLPVHREVWSQLSKL